MKHFIDRIQVWLYLAGFFRVASFLGRFGSLPLLVSSNEGDRITLPEDNPMIPIDVVEDPPEIRTGPGWSLDELNTGVLRVIDFDPTFHKNDPNIDTAHDLAFPTSPLDVN
jgi:hypothetical protein